jgi:hypothetical protein
MTESLERERMRHLPYRSMNRSIVGGELARGNETVQSVVKPLGALEGATEIKQSVG